MKSFRSRVRGMIRGMLDPGYEKWIRGTENGSGVRKNGSGVREMDPRYGKWIRGTENGSGVRKMDPGYVAT